MQVILRVLDGPDDNGQMWLRAGQLAEIGRSEYVDFAVPGDSSMCEVHFSLYCDGRYCYVKDLSRGAGTAAAGVQAGDELGPGDRTLRRNGRLERGEPALLRKRRHQLLPADHSSADDHPFAAANACLDTEAPAPTEAIMERVEAS